MNMLYTEPPKAKDELESVPLAIQEAYILSKLGSVDMILKVIEIQKALNELKK